MSSLDKRPELVVLSGTRKRKRRLLLELKLNRWESVIGYTFGTAYMFWGLLLVSAALSPGYEWVTGIVFLLFSAHAVWRWPLEFGFLRGCLSVFMVLGICGIAEYIGAKTGKPFGGYSFDASAGLGAMVVDAFPWPLLAVWLGAIGVANQMGRCLAEELKARWTGKLSAARKPDKRLNIISFRSQPKTFFQFSFLAAFISALLSTWFAFIFEPASTVALHYRIWEAGPLHFQGIPLGYFAAWFLISFLVTGFLQLVMPLRRMKLHRKLGSAGSSKIKSTFIVYLMMLGILSVVSAHSGQQTSFWLWVLTCAAGLLVNQQLKKQAAGG